MKASMDIMCEQASAVVEYIVKVHTDIPIDELALVSDSGDIVYSDRVQDIFNNVLDLIEENGEKDESN